MSFSRRFDPCLVRRTTHVNVSHWLAAPKPQSSIPTRHNLRETTMPGIYPLPTGDLKSLGFANKPLDHLDALIRSHIDEGRYPGAQIALARHGKLALFRTYGNAKTEGGTVPATNETLFLLFSQTKVLTSAAV